MRKFPILMLLLLAMPAGSDVLIPPPTCYPGAGSCTAAYSALVVEDALPPYESSGICWQWYQIDASGDFYEAVGWCGRWSDDLPSLASFSGDTLWKEYVTRDLTPAEQRTWDGLLIHRPASVYVVALSSKMTSRPTFPVVNGVRSLTKNGRIEIGLPCRPSRLRVGDYADVSGQPNLLTNSPLPPGTVALCAKR